MSKLRRFFRQHVLWMGMLAVTVPLATILILQYRSLVKLEQTMPIADRAVMTKYLTIVAWQVQEFYKDKAEQVLGVPPATFEKGADGKHQLKKAVYHFRNNKVDIARRMFIGFSGEEDDRSTFSVVLFYNPDSESKLVREPGSPEWRAAHGACALYMLHSMNKTLPESASLTVDERDPNNRVIVKPIIDESSRRVVGIAGMVIDEEFFKNKYLPGAVESNLPRFFPTGARDVAVSLHDASGNRLLAGESAHGQMEEAMVPLQFIFKDWKLGIMASNITLKQGATRLFHINLSLSIVMTILVIGAIVIALRIASREMKLSQMKSDFVSNVSHELRTPLASIRVFGEFLRLGRVKEAQKIREYGEYIETESRRLTQLINNILDFSRIESGRKTYQFERADVGEVVSETLKAYEVWANQSGFRIAVKIADGSRLAAVIDPDAVAQAFMNLLDNAIKYSGDAREILVGVEKRDEYITISVTDHGIGIPQEESERIFEKFYRVGTGLVHDVKGSGLGLSIVKHIVEAHHGMVTLKSKPGQGSTFTIHLPVGRSLDKDEQARGQEPTASGHLPLEMGAK